MADRHPTCRRCGRRQDTLDAALCMDLDCPDGRDDPPPRGASSGSEAGDCAAGPLMFAGMMLLAALAAAAALAGLSLAG